MTVTPEVPRILSVPPVRNSNPSTSPKFPNFPFLRYSAGSLPAPKAGPAVQLLCFQQFVSACALFAAPALCFQHIVDSFAKDTGGRGNVRKIYLSSSMLTQMSSSAMVMLLPLPRGNWKYGVLRRRHRNVALAVAPQDGVQHLVIGLVRVPPVHRGRCLRTWRGRGIALED